MNQHLITLFPQQLLTCWHPIFHGSSGWSAIHNSKILLFPKDFPDFPGCAFGRRQPPGGEVAHGAVAPRVAGAAHALAVEAQTWAAFGSRMRGYQVGPPSDVCGFINHEITPINYSYIYHKATEIRQLNAILGAPSCTKWGYFKLQVLGAYFDQSAWFTFFGAGSILCHSDSYWTNKVKEGAIAAIAFENRNNQLNKQDINSEDVRWGCINQDMGR